LEVSQKFPNTPRTRAGKHKNTDLHITAHYVYFLQHNGILNLKFTIDFIFVFYLCLHHSSNIDHNKNPQLMMKNISENERREKLWQISSHKIHFHVFLTAAFNRRGYAPTEKYM
jgi:hypothetical protein